MNRRRRRFSLATAVLLGLTTLSAVSCFDMSDVEGPVKHKTYVQDWRDEIIYQILVDRFADGDTGNDYRIDRNDMSRYHGGDWKGIEDHLGYLQQLGVTTLWISPIVKNVENDAGIDGYHGYWGQDLTKLNHHFGDMAALRSMVNAAHKRGMKVILDIVTNHMGQVFFYDINGNGQPDEAVWGGGDLDGNREPTPIMHRTEYDPEYEEPQVMSRTSLGEAGPAPIIFFRDAVSNHMPPVSGYPEGAGWDVLQQPWAYHRRGRVWNWGNDHCCYYQYTGKTAPADCDGKMKYCNQVQYGDFPGGLKDVATEVPQVRDAMYFVYARWMKLVDFDGFRIDTIKHIEHGFWQNFAPRIRRQAAAMGKQRFFMFGEAFSGDDQLIGSYTFNNELDSVFYFSQKYAIDDVFKHGSGTGRLKQMFDDRSKNFSSVPIEGGAGQAPTKLLVNFLDNHDVARFLYDKKKSNGGIEALHTALTFLLTEDGIPCIYYGTEQQFEGGNDPNNREDMWNSGFSTSGATFQFIANLTALRKQHVALRRGDMSYTMWTDNGPGILAFERFTADDRVLVVINTSDKDSKETVLQDGSLMKTGFGAGTKLHNAVPDADQEDDVTVGAGGEVRVTLPPRGTKVFVAQ